MGLESSVGPGPLVPASGSSVSNEGAVVFLSADADARSEASVVVEFPPSTPGVSALEGAMVVEVESFSNSSVSGVSTSTASPDGPGVGLVEVVPGHPWKQLWRVTHGNSLDSVGHRCRGLSQRHRSIASDQDHRPYHRECNGPTNDQQNHRSSHVSSGLISWVLIRW